MISDLLYKAVPLYMQCLCPIRIEEHLVPHFRQQLYTLWTVLHLTPERLYSTASILILNIVLPCFSLCRASYFSHLSPLYKLLPSSPERQSPPSLR